MYTTMLHAGESIFAEIYFTREFRSKVDRGDSC